MSCTLNKEAYTKLVKEDIEALNVSMEEHSLERRHIEEVLRWSIQSLYAAPCPNCAALRAWAAELEVALETETARLDHILDAFDGDEDINGATGMDYWDADAMDADEKTEGRRAWRTGIDVARAALAKKEDADV